MKTLIAVSLAAVMSGASGAALSVDDAKDTHTAHSKEMKNDRGVKDGEKMESAKPAGAVPGPRDDAAGSTHKVHSKKMKNDTGVKDGQPMGDAASPPAGAAPAPGAAKQGTHTVHSKQMKNDKGTKDGDKMESGH
jgi:hypothetical protein